MGRSSLTAFDLSRMVALIGLVQEDFATVFNVRQATVSRWLSGKLAVPGYVEAWIREAHPAVYEMVMREKRVEDETSYVSTNISS